MKSLLGKLGIILIGLAIFGYAEVWAEDWKLYSSSPDGEYFRGHGVRSCNITYHPND